MAIYSGINNINSKKKKPQKLFHQQHQTVFIYPFVLILLGLSDLYEAEAVMKDNCSINFPLIERRYGSNPFNGDMSQ